MSNFEEIRHAVMQLGGVAESCDQSRDRRPGKVELVVSRYSRERCSKPAVVLDRTKPIVDRRDTSHQKGYGPGLVDADSGGSRPLIPE